MAFDPPQNLCLIWDNRAFDAETTILTPSSEVVLPAGNLYARNLQDPQRTRVWRTTGLISQSLTVDFGAAHSPACLGVIDHNLTTDGKMTLQASNATNFSSLLLNEEFDAWEPIIGAGELGAGKSLAGGYPTAATRSWLAPNPIRVFYFRPLPQDDVIEARYWRLLFDDPANPDGYFQIGRIFLCQFDEYVKQFGIGVEFDGSDDTIIAKTPGGQSWRVPRPFAEIRRTPWNTFRREDLFWKFLFFRKKVGLFQCFVADLIPAGNPAERYFNLLYCTLNGVPNPVGDNPHYFKLQMEFIESL